MLTAESSALLTDAPCGSDHVTITNVRVGFNGETSDNREKRPPAVKNTTVFGQGHDLKSQTGRNQGLKIIGKIMLAV